MLHPLQQNAQAKRPSTPPEKINGVNGANGNGSPSSPEGKGKKTGVRADDPIEALLARNEHWASNVTKKYPELFPSLAGTQKPQILWFGCSDSRVPETTILNLLPGEVFVHRNIANCLPLNDMSSLSVLQYAVEVLQVKHIIVSGHYGCGGVAAAFGQKKLGLIDVWLKNIRTTRIEHAKELNAIEDPEQRNRRLVELHTIQQVHNLLSNANVLEAIKERGLQVHGTVYDVGTGRIKKLDIPASAAGDVFDLE